MALDLSGVLPARSWRNGSTQRRRVVVLSSRLEPCTGFTAGQMLAIALIGLSRGQRFLFEAFPGFFPSTYWESASRMIQCAERWRAPAKPGTSADQAKVALTPGFHSAASTTLTTLMLPIEADCT